MQFGYWPRGIAVAPDGRVWVGTQTQVVGFIDPRPPETSPDRCIGTRNCNEDGQRASTTCGPIGVAIDSAGRRYVADAGIGRILLFSTPRTVEQAARVFGQPSIAANPARNAGGIPSESPLCDRRRLATDSDNDIF